MRKYKVNRTGPTKLPSKEALDKYKDFSRLSHEYDKMVKRPKVPLYRDKRMFLVLLLIALVALLLAQAASEEEDTVVPDDIDQVD